MKQEKWAFRITKCTSSYENQCEKHKKRQDKQQQEGDKKSLFKVHVKNLLKPISHPDDSWNPFFRELQALLIPLIHPE